MNKTATLLGAHIGDYQLVEFLGAGGMGEVYRGIHIRLGRVVAVKVLSKTASGTDFTRRFLNEAQIQSRLRHRHIATLYDFVESNDRLCIVMEYVNGRTLADRIVQSSGLPVEEALSIFQRVAAALDYVHAQGIIHRDVKPHNIKIDSHGEVKLLDFGIAKEEAGPGLTAAGVVVGTPAYLAPEQLRGRTVDARTDVWALGILLYEMLTGALPFEADSLIELYEKIDRADYMPPSKLAPGVSPEIEKIIRRCLQRKPSQRYASATSLLQDVEACLEAPILPGSPRKDRRWLPRPPGTLSGLHRTLAVKPYWLAAVGAALLLLTVVMTSGPSHTPPGDDTPDSVGTVDTPSNDEHIPASRLHTTIIDVIGPPAEVYRDGQFLGTTPRPIQAPIGEHISVTLRRNGAEKTLTFHVTISKKIYTERL